MTIRLQHDAFDVGAEIARLTAGNPKVGAVASFIGVVRDLNEGAAVATFAGAELDLANLHALITP